MHRTLRELVGQMSSERELAAIATAGDDYDPDGDGYSTGADGGCSASLMTEHFVSVDCPKRPFQRMDVRERGAAHHFTLFGGVVQPLDPYTLFSDAGAVRARVRAACDEWEEDAGEPVPYARDGVCSQLTVSLGSRCVVLALLGIFVGLSAALP